MTVREEAGPVPPPRAGEHVLAIDSTGISGTLRGERTRKRYHLRRGFVKAHVAVIVTDEREGEAKFQGHLVERGSRTLPGPIARAIADGGYDTRENFDFLKERGIEVVIRMRRNANMKRRGGSAARPLAVKGRNEIGEKAWRKKHSY